MVLRRKPSRPLSEVSMQAPKYGATPTGYYLKKYVDGSCVTTADNQTRRRHTWIVFRLGEFYLDFAEAAFNATGSANDKTFGISANDAINVLRTRADINMPKFKEDGDAWVERYERERLVEPGIREPSFLGCTPLEEGCTVL